MRKFFSEIEEKIDSKENVTIILIADLLDKKSKLRNLFENEKIWQLFHVIMIMKLP